MNCYSTFLFLFLVQAIFGSWMFSSSIIWFLALPQAAMTLFLILKPQHPDNINLPVILTLVTIAGCVSPLIRVFELQSESPEWFLWLFVVTQLIMIWESMSSWSRINSDHKPLLGSIINLIVPFLFGASLIYIWEILTVGFNVPQILLPSPHLIALAFAKSTSVLWADFQQTFVKAVLSGAKTKLLPCLTELEEIHFDISDDIFTTYNLDNLARHLFQYSLGRKYFQQKEKE